jgi:hypothetical protein
MLFWRTKTAKQTTPPAAPEAGDSEAQLAVDTAADQTTAPTETADPAGRSEPEPGDLETSKAASALEAKIITLPATRLADRLIEINGKSGRSERGETEVSSKAGPGLVDSDCSRGIAEQGHGHAALRAALQKADNGSHVLIVGPAGSGRRASAVSIAEEIARHRDAPADWIFATCSTVPGTFKAYAVPHGIGARMVRDVQDALAKSSAMLARLMSSDSHQISLAVLEEDHRQRSDGGLEHLRRRAEAQNIAVVRTSEGFVLAPMHEGRVVRSDVFRALPDALQRDVEAKISGLESELQALLGAMPGTDIAIDDRHLALSQQTAERAVKPNMAVARKLFETSDAIATVFDAIESDWTRRAAETVRRGKADSAVGVSGLQAISADAAVGAPVVVARSVSAAGLLGEIGRDAAGLIAIRPGELARANGGFLIIDAWRLAADPPAWAALTAALESGSLQPMPSPGLAVMAEPVPLNVTLVLIAEHRSLARLRAIDPRSESYFSHPVAFEVPAPAALHTGAAS